MEKDFIKLERKIKVETIFNRIKKTDARIIPELAVLLDEIGLVQILEASPAFITSGIGFIAISCYMFAKNMRCEKIMYHNECYHNIQSLLRTTDTYSNCIESYNDYIHKYNTFLNQLGITSPMEEIVIFQKMLKNGYLFKDKKGGYNNLDTPSGAFSCMFELDELLGCRVSTGTYVCRHVSSLLNDILNNNIVINENNIKPFYMQLKISEEESGVVADNKRQVMPNHAAILFKGNDYYFGYCPTMNCFISIEEYMEELKATKIKAYDISGKNIKYYGVIPEYYNDFLDDYQIEKDIFSSGNSNGKYSLGNDELSKLSLSYFKAQRKIDNYDKEPFIGFYINTIDNLGSMSEDITAMVPNNKKGKVKQLIIK
mgnify:FL=1